MKESFGEATGLSDKMSSYFFRNWVEVVFFILLIIGFLFSLLAPSAVLSYVIILFVGMVGGRMVYFRKKSMVFPYVFICIGFLLGYLIGARYGGWLVIIVLFVLGNILSYYLHDQGFIRDIKLWP